MNREQNYNNRKRLSMVEKIGLTGLALLAGACVGLFINTAREIGLEDAIGSFCEGGYVATAAPYASKLNLQYINKK